MLKGFNFGTLAVVILGVIVGMWISKKINL